MIYQLSFQGVSSSSPLTSTGCVPFELKTLLIASLCPSSIPSVNPSDVKHQEIPAKSMGTNFGEKILVEITKLFLVNILDDVILTQNMEKFPVQTPGNLNKAKSPVEFPSG